MLKSWGIYAEEFMNSKNFIRILCFIIFCGINAAFYFVLFEPLIEQHKKNQTEYKERQRNQNDLNTKQAELEIFQQQITAYQKNVKIYTDLAIPVKNTIDINYSLDVNHIEVYLASLGRYIRTEKVQAALTRESTAMTKYQCEIKELIVDFQQVNAFLLGLMQSTDSKFVNEITLPDFVKPEDKPLILRPRLFLIRELNIEPLLSGDDDNPDIPKDPLKLSAKFDYIYFVEESKTTP